jgi:hydrogenase maturation protease
MTRAVVIGVGNDYRGDDGVALAIVRRLEGNVPADVTVRSFEQEPTRLIDAWDGADTAIVVDAAGSGAEPGTLHRFDASAEPIPASVFRSSTHAFGVGEAIELARALGRLPRHVVVYGVEGGSFAAGEGLSPPVAEAVEPAAAAVLEELARLTREEEPCTSGR